MAFLPPWHSNTRNEVGPARKVLKIHAVGDFCIIIRADLISSYLFYASKEALFMDVVEQVEQRFRQELFAVVNLPGPSPRARLFAVLKQAFRLVKTIPLLQFLMPYRILCNGVKRKYVRTHPDQASRLFCSVPLHKIRYGVAQETARRHALAMCLRTYRGVPDLERVGVCYAKDAHYLRGLRKIEQAIAQDETVLDRLAVGVVALDRLPDLQELGIVTAPQSLRKLANDPNLDAYILSFKESEKHSTERE